MNKTILYATIAFQFTILVGLMGILGYQMVNTGELNEVVLGAVIGTFTGIPQSLISLMNAEDDK